jgi:pimeloyl-ACP methyl ester carboxylesterase
MMPNFPLQNYLRRVRCPVLVLQGEEDIYGGRTQYEVLRDNLPHVEHELYAGAGHHLHREQTEQVLQRVNQFLMDAQPGRHQNTTAAHSQLERSDP